MSNISDIQAKYLRLIEIYADKNLDNSGAEAQNLIAELAGADNEDYKTAVKLAKSKLNPTQKFYTATAERNIGSARKNTGLTPSTTATAAPAPTPTPNNTVSPTPVTAPQATVAPTQPSVTTPQPSAPKNKNKPQTATKPAASKPAPQSRDLPKEVADDLNKFIYGDVAFYSDTVADYMEADGLSAREKVSHNLNIIDHIWNEYKKRPATPEAKHIDRQKLLEIGLSVGYCNKEDKVQTKVQKFLSFMSGKAQRYYLKKGKDYFLNDLQVAHSKVAPKVDDTAYIDKIASRHVTGIFESLETNPDKLKYFKLLRKRNLLQYVPQELQNNLTELEKQSKDAPKKQPQGDKKMTDETKEENTFNPSAIQKWACLYAKLNYKDYKDEASLIDALGGKGVIIQGNNVIDMTMEEIVHKSAPRTKEEAEAEEARKYALRDDGLSPDDLPSGKLNVSVIDPGKPKEEPQKDDTTEKPLDWVQKKIEDYTAMSAAGKISNFEYDKENKKEFIASFNGAQIHYSSPDNVQVSENAGINIFETILNEPDNQNRTINFSDNMPHNAAMHLKAACLLNGRAMTGTLPEFTKEDMEALHQELGDERFKKLNEILNPPHEEERPAEEKAKISSAEELSKAAEDIKKIKDNFNQMKADGLIAVSTNLETKQPEIVAGPAWGNTEEDKQKAQKAVDDANALIASAAAIVMASKTVEGKLNEEQQKANNDFNAARLEHIRQNMDHKKLEEKADYVALIHAKRMGLVDVEVKDNKGNEVKTIENDAQRKAYSEERNKNPELSARIAKVVQQNQASK